MAELYYLTNDLTVVVWVAVMGLIAVQQVVSLGVEWYRSPSRSVMEGVKRGVNLFIFLVIVTLFTFFYNVGTTHLFVGGATLTFSLSSLVSSLVVLIAILGFRAATHKNLSTPEEQLIHLMMVVVTPFFFSINNLLALIIGIEVFTFCFVVLIGTQTTQFSEKHGVLYTSSGRNMEATVRYLVPGLFASLLLMVGVAVLYTAVPTLEFETLQTVVRYQHLTLSYNSQLNLVTLATGLLVVGFFFKLTVAPFHRWVFGVYQGLPLDTAFFLSIVPKLVYLFAFVKLIWPFVALVELHYLVGGLGLISVWVGTFHGLYEERINSILAASGVLNIGYVLVGLGFGGELGVSLAVLSLMVYAGLLLALMALLYRPERTLTKKSWLVTVDQLIQYKFWSLEEKLAFLLIVFSLIGVPPLVGFFPKFFIFVSLFIHYPILLSWFFLAGVIVSAFIYLKWVFSFMLSEINNKTALKRLAFSDGKRGGLILFGLVWLGWDIGVVDTLMVVASLIG